MLSSPAPDVNVHTMAVPRSATLVAWARAWRTGLASYDEVVDETSGDDAEHMVEGLGDRAHAVSLNDALGALSRLDADDIRLVLPTPGDPRGLPGPGPFTAAALTSGEGAVCGALGLVPDVAERVSGSGETWHVVTWHAYPVAVAAADPLTVAEAEHDLVLALRDSADALQRLDVARWRPELTAALADLRRSADGPTLPRGYDARCHRLLARAATVGRILALAAGDTPGGAVTAWEAAEREAALRPLSTAARRAYVTAINAPLR
jgi:hypothetical protein